LPVATDLELVRRARRGDAAAFHDIVDRYAQRLFGLAYSLLGSAADAEDAVQETLAGAYRGLARFEERAALWTWLARILVRQAAKQRRGSRGRKLLSLDSGAAQEEQPIVGDARLHALSPAAIGVDVRLDLAEAIKTLSEDHREVIVLREIEQMSYDEIAQVLAVPRGTVESRLHRARAELKVKLAAYFS
jgi:RNA polymerase sigma-70 factor (ECF subfamily)